MSEMSNFLYKVIDEAAVDITKRMAGVELKPGKRKSLEDTGVIRIRTTGTYDLSLSYVASASVFQAIADSMKRAPAVDMEDVSVYVKEYFNILCGRIISRINRETKHSARFGLAEFEYPFQTPAEPDGEILIELTYEFDSMGMLTIVGASKCFNLNLSNN